LSEQTIDITAPIDGSRGPTRLMQSTERSRYATFRTTNRVAQTRRCWDCQEWKPLDDYHRNADDVTHGRKRLCKTCSARRAKAQSAA